MAYKYRIFLRRDKDGKPVILKKPYSFRVPLNQGETITLPERHKNLRDMPEWAKKQVTWVVSYIIHIPDSDSFLILTSAESILSELIFNSVIPETNPIFH